MNAVVGASRSRGTCFMTKLRLTCPCGHSWEHSTTQPIPANVREICPVCAPVESASGTRVAPPPTAADPVALRPGQTVGGFEII